VEDFEVNSKPAGPDMRRGAMRALAADLPGIAKPVLGKRGFAEAQMVAQWPDIVGSELARRLLPEKLSFPRGERRDGVLRLRVKPAFALEVQHREPQILERINAFFGYRAVARLVLAQGRIAPESDAAQAVALPLDETERRAVAERVAAVDNPELRAALQRLGEAVTRAGKRRG
jgi:hypothetical protein